LAQGVEATSAEEIAADAGVSLRTFYRHFASKHDLLFEDYDASLAWFRLALDGRPAEETVTEAVLAAINSFPFERDSMYDIAALRDRELDQDRIERHIRQVQAEFAVEIERYLLRRDVPEAADSLFLTAVSAQCIAAATFAAVDIWMRTGHADLDELARLTELALTRLERGILQPPSTLGSGTSN
jgi:AcrR family transcriptional regulator